MAIQQLSYGGAATPIGVASVGTSPTVSTTTSISSLPDLSSLTQTGDFIYSWPGLDINQLEQQNAATPSGKISLENTLEALDPFNTLLVVPQDATTGSFASGPGYQTYGTAWYDFLDALNNVKNPALQYRSAGGAGYPQQQIFNQEQQASFATDPLSTREVQGYGGGDAGTPYSLSQLIDYDYNAGATSPTYGGTPQERFQATVGIALPQVAEAFGVDPSSPQAQELAQMYVTDVLQTDVKEDVQGYESTKGDQFQKTISGIVGSALTDLAFADVPVFLSAINAANAFEQGNNLGGALSLIGGAVAAGDGAGFAEGDSIPTATTGNTSPESAAVASGTESSVSGETTAPPGAYGNLASVYSNLNDYLNGPSSSPVTNAATSIASAPVLSTPGTLGTNAPVSGGVISSITDSLGITPEQLNEGVGFIGTVNKGASIAVPLIEDAVNAPGDITLSQPLSTPAATPAEDNFAEPTGKPISQTYAGQTNFPTQNATSLQRLLQEMGAG